MPAARKAHRQIYIETSARPRAWARASGKRSGRLAASLYSSSDMHHKTNEEQNQKDDKEDLGYTGESHGDTAKPE